MAGGVRVRADGVQTGGETERVWKRGELGLGTGRPVVRDGGSAQMDGAARRRSSAVFSRENDLLIVGWGAGLVLARIKKHPLPSNYEVRGFKVMSTSTI